MDKREPLSDEQVAALRAYAAEHGRTWKRKLNVEWMNASASQVLHLLRNTHGPSWLHGYRLPEVAEAIRVHNMIARYAPDALGMDGAHARISMADATAVDPCSCDCSPCRDAARCLPGCTCSMVRS